MPWGTKTVSEAKRQFVALARSPNRNFRTLCHQFNMVRMRGIGDHGKRFREHRLDIRNGDAVLAAFSPVALVPVEAYDLELDLRRDVNCTYICKLAAEL
jgi:hypothetical protein